MSVQLGSMTITSGNDTVFQGCPTDGVKAILIGNESGLTVTITMESGGVQKTLYPSTLDWFQVNKGFNGNIKIHPIALLNNVSQWPSSSLLFDAIGLNDPEQAGMYPLALARQTNIGNNLNLSTSATAIDNEGNAANTSIIKSIVSGDGTNQAVSLTNDGILTIGDAAHHGSVSFDNGGITSDGSGNLATTGNVTVNGFLKTNTIKDNVTGVDQLDLATAGITINKILTLVSTLSIAGTHTTVTGNTHGTADVFEVLVGKLKALIVTYSAFANNGGDQDVTIGTAYTQCTWFYGSDSANMGFKDINGVKQNTGILTTLSTGAAAGATTTETTILQNSFGASNTGFAKLSFLGAAGATQRNGMFLVFGQ